MGGGSETGAEVLPWLKSLPLAPEYRPSLSEFQDPIAYIFKIEKEASQYGICKIIPPLPPSSKKTAISHLNRSLASLSPESEPTFSTRQQQIGWCPRKQPHPVVRKSVWQSGECYTVRQFEEKARHFAKTRLGKKSTPLTVESLFWKATADKPFRVEYANDLPGSAFGEPGDGADSSPEEAVGRSAWNMRAVSRARGSLLRYMPEEIPGVTSPMVYIAMLFSWFAWHVEDHDLHSLNYLHFGAPKTWYGVPREAAFAFEEVIRVHGYGGELNPLAAFATLGEKTTVMSPEVLVAAGVPCCRLVQNAGEFVVTFPRAYHSGFSHGFNCGEAANIATPEWLTVAKEAAIRRASINHLPMVSHFQLLYTFVLASSSRISASIPVEPRSLRLKDKKRGEGESVVRELFIQNVVQTDELLHVLYSKGSLCLLLPPNDSLISSCSTLGKVKARMSSGLCSSRKPPDSVAQISSYATPERMMQDLQVSGSHLMKGKSEPIDNGNRSSAVKYIQCEKQDFTSGRNQNSSSGDLLLDQGFFSCVTCGILGFACMAVIQPSELSARSLLSRDCSYLSAQIDDSGLANHAHESEHRQSLFQKAHFAINDNNNMVNDAEFVVKPKADPLYDHLGSNRVSALNLLAVAYGDPSDSEEDVDQHFFAGHAEKPASCHASNTSSLMSSSPNETPVDTDDALLRSPLDKAETAPQSTEHALKSPQDEGEVSAQICRIEGDSERTIDIRKEKVDGLNTSEYSSREESENFESLGTLNLKKCDANVQHKVSDRDSLTKREQTTEVSKELKAPANSDTVQDLELTGSTPTCNELLKAIQDEVKVASASLYSFSRCVPNVDSVETAQFRGFEMQGHEPKELHLEGPNGEFSRMHVFCLEHALKAQRQLEAIGGARILLLCHPDYPEVRGQAKLLAGEMGIHHDWKDIEFKECSPGDLEKIESALDDDLYPRNGDWAVKLGINLVHTANLSRSPLYSKQMPYNPILYEVFGCHFSENNAAGQDTHGKSNRPKKLVAGKWCGKVWMANQVHPYLACIDAQTSKQGDDFVSKGVESEPEQSPRLTQQESFSEANILVEVCTSRRSAKRRMPFEKSRKKRLKCPEWESSPLLHSQASPEESKCIAKGKSKFFEVPTICYSRKADRGNVTPKMKHEQEVKQESDGGPSTRLRTRPSKTPRSKDGFASIDKLQTVKQAKSTKQLKKTMLVKSANEEAGQYECDIEGCSMSFNLKLELVLHKRNICAFKGCGKRFFSHKYLLQHRRVHMDDRPLKCPWKGCKMTFKWAWARTEHIRVHTGARPYVCKETGCGQTFRFVSDFSRHKRKTGHSVKKSKG